MLCPSNVCRNDKQYLNPFLVHAHLILWGFLDDYACWNKHGEEGVNDQDGEKGLDETCASGNEEAPFGNGEAPFSIDEIANNDVEEITASPIPTVHENLDELMYVMPLATTSTHVRSLRS